MQDILLTGMNIQYHKSLNSVLTSDYYTLIMLKTREEADLYVKENKADFIIFDEDSSNEETTSFIKSIRLAKKALSIIIVRSKLRNISIVVLNNADISYMLFRSELVCSTFLQILEKITKAEKYSSQAWNTIIRPLNIGIDSIIDAVS